MLDESTHNEKPTHSDNNLNNLPILCCNKQFVKKKLNIEHSELFLTPYFH